MNAERVLIIEDDPTLLRGLKDNFTHAGYRVLAAANGHAGLQLAVDRKPELIILDIMLPDINGYEICRAVRAADLEMPIIMLTAKSQESDIILGLNLGADDYVTKPFSIQELLARAQAFLRRRHKEADQRLEFGNLTVEVSSRLVLKNGREVPLTPKEFDLLVFLARNGGRALTRDQILNAVWGHGLFVNTRSVDRCVTTLRGKVEPHPARPSHIKTVHAIGYRFDG